MNIYYLPGACSLASHIVAREAELEVRPVKVLFNTDGTRTTELGENYFEINKMGYVPALKTNDGEILTEGPAILQYLADLAPEKALIFPAGTMDRYHLIEWLTFVSSEVHKTFSTLFRSNLPESEKEFTINKLHKRFEHIEEHLTERTFIMGEQFTIVDAYLFTVMNWKNKFGIDIKNYPKLEAYLQMIVERPAVQKAMKVEGLL